MKAIFKAALLAGAAWSVVPTLAVAQVTPNAAGVVEELVVTARRREESLKDVPVAVTAITAERLSLIGATDITTMQQTTPNLTVQVARGSNSTLISFIRGIGQQDRLDNRSVPGIVHCLYTFGVRANETHDEIAIGLGP